MTAAPELWQLVLGIDEPGGVVTRVASASLCKRCDALQIQGLDDDMMAFDAFADPEPISAFGEVQATIAGLRTYELTMRRGGYEVTRRSAGQVRGRPAGSGIVDVLAEHRCGTALARASPVLRLVRTAVPTVPPF